MYPVQYPRITQLLGYLVQDLLQKLVGTMAQDSVQKKKEKRREATK